VKDVDLEANPEEIELVTECKKVCNEEAMVITVIAVEGQYGTVK
jgi:hypothetical protein